MNEQTAEEIKEFILASFSTMEMIYTNAADMERESFDYMNQAIISGAKVAILFEIIDELGWKDELSMNEETRQALQKWGYAI